MARIRDETGDFPDEQGSCDLSWRTQIFTRYNSGMSSAPPSFPKHDPADAAFWDVRFDAEFTPWEQGGTPQLLREYLAQHKAKESGGTEPPRVLIPGCGSGQEVRLFVDAGWDALAIDFSPSAVAAARAQLGTLADRIREADFFARSSAESFAKPFDAIYERAFLCALPPRLRPAWAARVAELLKSGGQLFGFWYFDSNPKGPPFGIDKAELTRLLEPAFIKREEKTPIDSISVFAGKENWQVWQRR
jgi:SAM-dependent methyltransferase